VSSEPIEGEPSYLKTIPILSPSMPTTNICFEPISKPILDPDDPSKALPPESYDDPIIDFGNPLKQPRHGNNEGHKSDQEEHRQQL